MATVTGRDVVDLFQRVRRGDQAARMHVDLAATCGSDWPAGGTLTVSLPLVLD
ncbi:MAG TPA: hypothetical protein VGF25_19785 [Thermoleophilaceae bacterium]|jgi:hypothetical protein